MPLPPRAPPSDPPAASPRVPPDEKIPRLTIRRTLAGLVAACIVPAVLGLCWMLALDDRAQRATWSNDVVTRARTMRLLLDGNFATPDAIVAATGATLPAGWLGSVIDREGRIVARTRDRALFVGQPATPSLASAIAGRPEGVAEALSKDGEPMLAGFSRSDRTGWTIVIGVPRATIDRSLHRAIAVLAIGVLIVLAAVLWIAWRVSRMVSQAVGGLVEPALSLGAGRPIDLPPTALRETDAVGRAMRQASRKLAAAQHHAYHDPLTNLRNRTLFDEMALRQIAQAYRDGAQLAILAIDLDGFKAVNDQHGHAAGDIVLRTVADRITALVRGSDVVSRRGGDEFSVLLVDVDGLRTRQVAEKLLAALSQPYPDVRPAVSASIGVARYPQDATTLSELLEHADLALYAAKHAGKRRVVGDF